MKQDNLLDQQSHFAFGENWLDYARKIDEEKISRAMDDLRRLSGRQRLDGMSFLDIGCGSGLSALAAMRLGASRVAGIDIDPDSVKAAREVFARFAPALPADFQVCSVFEMSATALGTFDIVYSWGVLHHTGDMVRAIETAAALVRPGGEFYLALYRKTPFCGMWRFIKRWYSKAPPASQQRARKVYVLLRKITFKAQGRDFDAYVRDYGCRGMDYYNDVHDWLGGYPYQSVTPDECRALLARLGFAVDREFVRSSRHLLTGIFGSGCDQYAFHRESRSLQSAHEQTTMWRTHALAREHHD
jgi:2-polyprenyl-6-hydroxyphenyl methylase/3-demethylubiquinone-9 3-methyltransferase